MSASSAAWGGRGGGIGSGWESFFCFVFHQSRQCYQLYAISLIAWIVRLFVLINCATHVHTHNYQLYTISLIAWIVLLFALINCVAHAHTHTHTHTHTHMHTVTHTYMLTYAEACSHARTHTHTTHAHIYRYTCTHMHTLVSLDLECHYNWPNDMNIAEGLLKFSFQILC